MRKDSSAAAKVNIDKMNMQAMKADRSHPQKSVHEQHDHDERDEQRRQRDERNGRVDPPRPPRHRFEHAVQIAAVVYVVGPEQFIFSSAGPIDDARQTRRQHIENDTNGRYQKNRRQRHLNEMCNINRLAGYGRHSSTPIHTPQIETPRPP